MIIQDCNLLLVILTKIESIVLEQKAQHPHLSDEEIIDSIKKKFLTKIDPNIFLFLYRCYQKSSPD